MNLLKNLDVDLMYDENEMFGESIISDFHYFKDLLCKYNPDANFDFLKRAFALCCFYHKSDKRKSGKPYYTHPLWVAIFLIEKFRIYDEIYLAAAFLHDTIEDTESKRDKVTKEVIAQKMNSEELAEIVEALTKISHDRLIIENENYTNQLIHKYSPEKAEEFLKNKKIQKCFTHRKLFQTFVKNQNIIIIKLADRLHNMKTLHYMEVKGNPERTIQKRKEIAEETLEFYVRFANRLGFSKIASELQNLSFYFSSDKELYSQIRQAIESKQSFILERLTLYQNDINDAFRKSDIEGASIHIYHRQEYEIYNLTNQFTNIDKLPDFVTCIVAVPVNDNSELRKATSKLIQQFGHSNVSNYQEGKQILGEYEFDTIQIRVKKTNLDSLDITIMSNYDHDILDNFIAVPIKEKRLKKKVVGISEKNLDLWSDWMEYIILEKGENSIKDIWDSLDKNLFDERIVCFSVDKEAIYLPKGATVLDFAFAISKETGLNFSGAKIQEHVYDINYVLSGNETIQILKSKKMTVIPEWSSYISDYRALGYFYEYIKSIHKIDNSLLNSSEKNENEYSINKNIYDTLSSGFFGKIVIKGSDRMHLLNDISKAIGNSEIRKSTIQKSEDNSKQFEGVFDVYFKNHIELNNVILQLLDIRNVKSAEVISLWSN